MIQTNLSFSDKLLMFFIKHSKMTSVNALSSIRLSVKGNYTEYILNIFRVLLAHLKSIVWANWRLITHCCYVLSVVWHISLPLMNSFNKIEAAVSMQAVLSGGFLFHQFNYDKKMYFTNHSTIFYWCQFNNFL